MIAALKLDDLFAAGEGAHQAQHRHAGLGAAVDEAHHLHRWHRGDHHLGEGVFQGAGGAEAGSLVEGLMQGGDHLGVGMAADCWPPAADVVDVAVAVYVPGVGALDPIKNDRLATDRLKRPHRRADATWHQALGSIEELLGAARVKGRTRGRGGGGSRGQSGTHRETKPSTILTQNRPLVLAR